MEWKEKFNEEIVLFLDENEVEKIKNKNIYEIIFWIYYHPNKNRKRMVKNIFYIKENVVILFEKLMNKIFEKRKRKG